MFKLFAIVLLASAVFCFEDDFQFNPEDDILVPVEVLPPRTLVRMRRQLFGGFSTKPFGGFDQHIGYKGSNAWGSISQSGIPSNKPFGGLNLSPATFTGGAQFKNSAGTGLFGDLSHTQKLGGTGTLGANLNVLNRPSHNLDLFATRTQNWDKNFKFNSPASTTFGTKYTHESGANLGISKTLTPGQPNVFQYSGATPLFKGKAELGLQGQTVQHVGTQATLAGKVHLTDNVNAFGSHTRAFDSKMHTLGSSSTLGAGLNHPSGLEASLSGTKTSGEPLKGTLQAAVPLFQSKDGNTKVLLSGQSTIQSGHKPEHQAGLTVSSSF